jgi:Domain of unknown function (DUF4129)
VRTRLQPDLRRLALALAGILALLAVVALVSRGHRFVGGSSEQRTVSSAFTDYLVSFGLAFGVIAVVTFGIVAKWGRVETSSLARGRRRSLLRRLYPWLFLTAVVLFFAYARPHIRFPGQHAHARKAPSAATARSRGAARREREARAQEHHLRWLPVVLVLGVALTGVFALGVLRWQSEREAEEELPLTEALSDVLGDTLDDLRAERDPRLAVIGAYARMERTLASYGLPRRSFEAPLEYLARVLGDLHASSASVQRLTDLFEKARFSRHEIDAPMKEDAIAALTSLRGELGEAA